MVIDNIVKGINDALAGELLTYNELQPFMDEVIDDINSMLDTVFPAFSEFNYESYPNYPDYNFFPERYIRAVVIKGAAYKFYIMDEEGLQTAPQFGIDYENGKFLMLRDYLEKIPEEFKAENQASVVGLSDVAYIWPCRAPKEETPEPTSNN